MGSYRLLVETDLAKCFRNVVSPGGRGWRKGEGVSGSVTQRGPEAEPWWASGGEPPETEKHDKLCTFYGITLVNAYCPLTPHNIIITFVFGFSRSSLIDFKSLRIRLPPLLCVHNSHFSSDLLESQDQVQAGWGSTVPLALSPWRS